MSSIGGELEGLSQRLRESRDSEPSLLEIIRRAEKLPPLIEAAMRQRITMKGSGLTIEDVIRLEPVREWARLSTEFKRALERLTPNGGDE